MGSQKSLTVQSKYTKIKMTTVSSPNLLQYSSTPNKSSIPISSPSKIIISPERIERQLKTTRSAITGRKLSNLQNPHDLRSNRVKSAYTFSKANDSKHTRRISSIYAEEINKAKQKFLLAENFTSNEFNSALGSASEAKSSVSLSNAGLAEILLISNDRNRECTLLANEQTNIDFLKKQKRLALEYKVKINKIDREIEIWNKKLEELQTVCFDETPEMKKLRRHCQNRANQIEQERSKSEHKLQRQQRIFSSRFYDMTSSDAFLGGSGSRPSSRSNSTTERMSRMDRRRVKSAIGF